MPACRPARIVLAVGLAVVLASLSRSPAPAADAQHPYTNIDPRYDAGNDTGDAQVEALNTRQLSQNYRGSYHYGRPPRLRRLRPAYPFRPRHPPPLPPPGY